MQGMHVDPMFRFLYPPNWSVHETGDEYVRMVEVESPDKLAYILIRVQPGQTPEELMQEALDAMVHEYEGLYSESVEATIDGQIARGYDLEFVSLDFPIGGLLRSIDTPEGAMIVQGQWSEVDDSESAVSHGDVIAAILTSIELSFTYDEDE